MDASNWMGSTVEVVRGRKVPKGTVGVVRWAKEGKWGWRVGLKVASRTERGLVFVAAKNCEVREAGAQTKQRELFGASTRDDETTKVPDLLVWFERFSEHEMSLVAFNGRGEKLVHNHIFTSDGEAVAFVHKVRRSGKSWDDLRGSGHWLTGDAEVDLAHAQLAAV